MIRDPETIKKITIKDFDHFEDHRNIINDKVNDLCIIGTNLYLLAVFRLMFCLETVCFFSLDLNGVT